MNTLEHAPFTNCYPCRSRYLVSPGNLCSDPRQSLHLDQAALRTTWYMQSSLGYSSSSACHRQTRSTFYILLIDETWNSWPLLCGICPSSSVHEIPTLPSETTEMAIGLSYAGIYCALSCTLPSLPNCPAALKPRLSVIRNITSDRTA